MPTAAEQRDPLFLMVAGLIRGAQCVDQPSYRQTILSLSYIGLAEIVWCDFDSYFICDSRQRRAVPDWLRETVMAHYGSDPSQRQVEDLTRLTRAVAASLRAHCPNIRPRS